MDPEHRKKVTMKFPLPAQQNRVPPAQGDDEDTVVCICGLPSARRKKRV